MATAQIVGLNEAKNCAETLVLLRGMRHFGANRRGATEFLYALFDAPNIAEKWLVDNQLIKL